MDIGKMQKWLIVVWIGGVILSIGIIGFLGWVIIKLLQHWSII